MVPNTTSGLASSGSKNAREATSDVPAQTGGTCWQSSSPPMTPSPTTSPGTSSSTVTNKRNTYKHIPHCLKPAHLVAKRNARERTRVQAVNLAFGKLRKHVPYESRHKRLSKVKTLRLAVQYIQHLRDILHDHDTKMARQQAAGYHDNSYHEAARARRRAKISDTRYHPPAPTSQHRALPLPSSTTTMEREVLQPPMYHHHHPTLPQHPTTPGTPAAAAATQSCQYRQDYSLPTVGEFRYLTNLQAETTGNTSPKTYRHQCTRMFNSPNTGSTAANMSTKAYPQQNARMSNSPTAESLFADKSTFEGDLDLIYLDTPDSMSSDVGQLTDMSSCHVMTHGQTYLQTFTCQTSIAH